MKKIVMLKIVYNDGTSLKLNGDDAASVVRTVDSLIARGIRAAGVIDGQRVGSDAMPRLQGLLQSHASPRIQEQPEPVPPDTGTDPKRRR